MVDTGESIEVHLARLGVDLEDCASGTCEVDIGRKLVPQFGWISVTTEPAGLAVWLDGSRIGVSPLLRNEVDPGTHTVRVRDSRYRDAGRKGFGLRGNQHREFRFEPEARMGGIRVRAVDGKGNALAREVELDGRAAGTTPWAERVIVGAHRVMLGGETREVEVVEGAVSEVEFEVVGGRTGSPSSEEGRDSDERQHRVTLTRGFLLASTEVTQGQWRSVVGRNPSHFKGDYLPVENVSWYDAVKFCTELSEREGLTPAYRIRRKSVSWDRSTGFRPARSTPQAQSSRYSACLFFAPKADADRVQRKPPQPRYSSNECVPRVNSVIRFGRHERARRAADLLALRFGSPRSRDLKGQEIP